MPAIAPGYLYTFFAIIAVISILLVSFTGYVSAIRLSSEMGKLKDLVDLVAAKSTELINLAKAANTTAETFIHAPLAIGNRQYWLVLGNDSSRVWAEGGFGSTPIEKAGIRVYLLSTALAYGHYVSGYGAILLKCSMNQEAGIPKVQLSSSSQNGE
ncbi:MAG: hypothetical protein QXZ47_01525 [Candidatus Bathyarchaeia archaeon]